jgi:hypothetical protein
VDGREIFVYGIDRETWGGSLRLPAPEAKTVAPTFPAAP